MSGGCRDENVCRFRVPSYDRGLSIGHRQGRTGMGDGTPWKDAPDERTLRHFSMPTTLKTTARRKSRSPRDSRNRTGGRSRNGGCYERASIPVHVPFLARLHPVARAEASPDRGEARVGLRPRPLLAVEDGGRAMIVAAAIRREMDTMSLLAAGARPSSRHHPVHEGADRRAGFEPRYQQGFIAVDHRGVRFVGRIEARDIALHIAKQITTAFTSNRTIQRGSLVMSKRGRKNKRQVRRAVGRRMRGLRLFSTVLRDTMRDVRRGWGHGRAR